jgi:hypothetical protein
MLVINHNLKAEEFPPVFERRYGSIVAPRFEATHASIARWTLPGAHNERELDSSIVFYNV